MINLSSIYRRYRVIYSGLALNCASSSQAIRAKTCSRAAKNPCHPELARALVGLLPIRPEARLLRAQVGPRGRRGESPSNDTPIHDF
jgi:hypothetical protein